MHRLVLLRAPVLAMLLMVLTAGTALGHECFVANRSESGNRAAGEHSRNWHTVDVAELFAFAHFILPELGVCIEPLSQGQIDDAVAMAEAAGIPTTPTIFARASQSEERPQGVGTLAENSRAYTEGAKAVDGKGVDWFFTKYAGQVIAIIFAVDPTIIDF